MSSDGNLGWKTSNSAIYIGTYLQWDSVFVSDEGNETYFHFWKLQSTCIEKKTEAMTCSGTYFLAFCIEYEHVCTRTSNCILPGTVCHFKTIAWEPLDLRSSWLMFRYNDYLSGMVSLP